MGVRQARLDDVMGIRDIAIADIARWQRVDEQGQVFDLPYAEMTIYERWLHGGAWMTLETGAIWLTHLTSGTGLALVHQQNRAITGYAEAYFGDESDPYNDHLHISILLGDEDAKHALVNAIIQQAHDVSRVTVASTVYDADKLAFYDRFGFNELGQIQRVNLSAQGGTVGFYKVTPHDVTDASQIDGWQMPIGRLESARYHWEHLLPQLWFAVPSITERKIHRLRFNVGGQDAFVVLQEQLYNPRSADVYCWTPKALSTHLVGSIRDWAYKIGFRSLTMAVSEKIAPILDSDLEQTAHQNVVLARNS